MYVRNALLGKKLNYRLKLQELQAKINVCKWISVVSVKLMTIHVSIGFSVCFL